MCCPLYLDPSIQVTRDSGTILPGETPIQAAARRHRERKSREESERRESGLSDGVPDNPSTGKDTTMQEIQEKAPEVSEAEVEERKKRRSSWGDRWRDFKHHHLP